VPFIDKEDYYRQRKADIDYIRLVRLYYRGRPYEAEQANRRDDALWAELLNPTDGADPPNYVDNVIRTLIEGICSDIFPPDSRLLFGNLKEDAAKQIADKLLNFGPRFTDGMAGFPAWVYYVLTDVAQPGDGLLFPRLKDGKLRLHYYPGENWAVELGPDADEPEFYRVEYRYSQEDGRGGLAEFWHRFDIYKDFIRRYRSEKLPTPLTSAAQPPAELSPVPDDLIGYMPPPLDIDTSDPQRDAAEAALLAKLDRFVCVPLRWNLLEEGKPRGESLATLDKLVGTDDVNRLLSGEKKCALKTDAILGVFDAEVPEGEGETGGVLTEDLAGQTLLKMTSEGDKAGRWGYPDNMPTEFAHAAIREKLRQAVYGHSQNLALAMNELMKTGNLSGFAVQQLNKYHDKQIAFFRGRLIEGILEQLRIGMQMLQIAGELTEEQAKAEPHIEFGAAQYSPDEVLKLATALPMYRNLGVPAEEWARQIPFPLQDPGSTVKELDKKQEADAAMSAQAQLARVAAPGPNGSRPAGTPMKTNPQRSPQDAAGVDKRARK
jgi:hypothetical protein